MKKIISLFLFIAITFTLVSFPTVLAEGNINVYVTVTDITDYETPINVLVPRQKITVSDFNIENYGDTLQGIQTVEGVSYLHALIQLHINLYGEDKVKDNLMLTTDGVTKIFMGHNVENVMYKNGRDIFSLPQDVVLNDGDEIQICLYNEKYSQAIATFEEAKIEGIAINEKVNLKLQQHYGSPRERDPIYGAEICDENGIYITDENGDIIETDIDGNFSLSFDTPGEYIISAMPEINYYITDTGGGIKIEYVPTEVVKKVEVTYTDTSLKVGEKYTNLSAEDVEALNEDNTDSVIVFEWGEYETELSPDNENYKLEIDSSEPTGGVLVSPLYDSYTVVEEKTVIELVPVEVIVSDELNPMVTYTTPVMVIDVTDNPIISKAYLEGNDLVFEMKNSEYNQNIDFIVASYDTVTDENGNQYDKMGMTSKAVAVNSKGRFWFDKTYDCYKFFFWEKGTLKPICEAHTYNVD